MVNKCMDKREVSGHFRVRLQDLHLRSGLRQAGFAARIGIDRSALSQLLTGAGARLPRAETLISIAATCQVSLDWLLGLSEDEGVSAELRDTLEIAEGADGADRSLLAQWHAEAAGSKIRYVPAGLPDQLRTVALTAHRDWDANANRDRPDFGVDFSRAPESDIEACMPFQTLEMLAAGQGVWSDLSRDVRRGQLQHMSRRLSGLYPAFRLFLFDGRARYSMPYTIFGYARVAIYAGDIYLLINAKQTIHTLVEHFDAHIRAATVQAHEVADFVEGLELT